MSPENSELLPCVEVTPFEGEPHHAVIWLHGLGADGHDFVPVVPELGLDPAVPVRFVFPHAPASPVTLNMGMRMPAWYDIREVDLQREHDEPGIRGSAEHVRALIQRENERGVPTERVFLAGFSQGGAMALFCATRHPEKLAGVVALSCYLVCEDSLDAERGQANASTPVFMAHGTEDPMVPVVRGQAARAALERRGYDVTWQTYPMQHAVCLEEIEAIGAFLRQHTSAEPGR